MASASAAALAAGLRARILAGEFGASGRLPSELSLRAESGATKGSVRAAYAELAAEGLVVASDRRGYFARLAPAVRLEAGSADSPDGLEAGWAAGCESARLEPGVQRSARLHAAGAVPGRVRELLGVAAGQAAVADERLLLAGGVPCAAVTWWRLDGPAAPAGRARADEVGARLPTEAEARELGVTRSAACCEWTRARDGVVLTCLMPASRAVLVLGG